MSHNGRSYVNWNFNGLLWRTIHNAYTRGWGSLVVSHYGAVRLFASWHNGVLCGHSKMCRQQAGAAVGVEPPQAAERPGASYHKDAA